ncbi:MAG TPA: hypothetical protein VFX59_12880, partial [Polyangiales bacterium]|nr:hypothetical protein [Polyangiales bacterium]
MKDKPELARSAAVHRTIPRDFVDISVGTSNGVTDLGVYAGQYIFLKALTVDVNVLLGKAIATQGAGFPIGFL